MLPSINLLGISLSTYWMTLASGAVGMLIYLWKRRFLFSLHRWQCILFTLSLTVVGILGAKILFVLENLKDTIDNGISWGGVSFFGSVFLIPILMPPVGRLFQLRSSQTMDICGPCVAIMIGCLRVGCFLSGCCGGLEVCLSGICLRWPTQALESIGDFVILLFLLGREGKNHPKLLYPLFMVLYSIMRFMLEFLRDTPKDWLRLSHGQWFALVAILVGAIWILGKTARKRNV